ncbi:unnamed protein product, partial [Heterosigma akashiwo]
MGCGVSAHKVNPNEIDLSHFSLERVIGRGGFGKVQACIKKSEPDKDRWYAIKTLKKDFILKSSGGVRSVYNELYALSQLQYVFLCNGHFAFQDSTQLYLVLDLALGGDLRYHLRHSPNGCFPEERARFYIIQLAMAVNYLHTKKMLHRDIKPDNILLCPNGYIKLTDMGIASRLENIEDCREVSGTRGYMAPEIYGKGHRHGPASDWFSVGVVLHEFLKGARPLGLSHPPSARALPGVQIQNWQRAKDKAAADHKETPRELGVLTLGSSVKKEARAFCEALLRLDLRARLRTLPDALQHAYLKGLDAQKVERLELPAPFIPDVSKANVDTGVHDIEEAFGGDEEDKPGPVSANDQEKFKDYALNNEFGKRRTSLARRLSRSGRRVGATSPRGERSRSRSGRRGSASTVGEP